MFSPRPSTPNQSMWKRKKLAAAIGIAITATVSLPATADSRTISSPVAGPITLTGSDQLDVTNSGAITLGASATTSAAVFINSGNGVSLTNAGLVSAGSRSSVKGVDDGGALLGTLNNTGTISVSATADSQSASATAVYFQGGISANGLLSNDGSITARASVTATATSYSASPGPLAYGLNLNGDMTGTLSNTGRIAASVEAGSNIGWGYATGLAISGDLAGTVNNSGTISASADGKDLLADMGATGVWADGVTGELDNSGGIAATVHAGSSAFAYGVGVGSGGIGKGAQLTNSGSISATGQSSDAYSFASANGIYVRGGSTQPSVGTGGSVRNSGSISATAKAWEAYAYGMQLSNDVAGTVNNSGNISVSAQGSESAFAFGILVGSSDGLSATLASGGQLTNTGTIEASVSGTSTRSSATGVLINTLNGSLTNSGTISGSAPDPSYGYSLWVMSGSGTVTNQAGGRLLGSLDTQGSVAMDNAGLISIPDGGWGHVAGNYTQTATGVYRLGASSQNDYATLTVGGAANLDGTIDVNLTPNNTIAAGQTLSGVVTAGSLNGTFSQVADNSLAYNFTAAYSGTSVDLTAVDTGLTTITKAVRTAHDPSAVGAAKVLDTLRTGGTNSPTIQSLLGEINLSGDPGQVAASVDQAEPIFNGSGPLIESRLLRVMQPVSTGHDGSESGRPSGRKLLVDRQLWVKPIGSWSDQNAKDGVPGYKSRFGGVMVGADGKVRDKTRLGLAFAYGHAHIDSQSDTVSQSSKVNLYQLIGYGRTALTPEMTLEYQVGIGRNHNDGHRNLPAVGRTANASYSSTTAHAGVGLNRAFALNATTRLIPSARLDYTTIHDEAYREIGAGGLDLNVDANTYQRLELGVGGKLVHRFAHHSFVTASVGTAYNALDDRAVTTTSFAGAPGQAFQIDGLRASRWIWHGGVGVRFRLKPRLTVSGGYGVDGQPGYTSQTVSAKLRWSF